ncbi:MAG: sulfurtransferase complex subunit TusB [Thermoplasmata archaeon]
MLFIANRAPSESDIVRKISIFSEGNDALIMFEDATLGCIDKSCVNRLLKMNVKLYALSADLEARGLLDQRCEGVDLIDYAKAIELIMEKYEKNITL